MRFALLGDHPDGVDFAGAVVDSGRHQLTCCAAPLAETVRQRLGNPPLVSDVEEVLADPSIDAIIVAGSPTVRPEQLRRAIQSERHVVCAHPADEKPDLAYEASMMQADVGYALMPLLPESLHPAIRRLGEFIDRDSDKSPVGRFHLLQIERSSPGEALDNTQEGMRPCIPTWDVLRAVGGELGEVSCLTDSEELAGGRPVLLAGSFVKGGLFQVTLLPGQPTSWWRLVVVGTTGRVELSFPQGWHGPAFLDYRVAGVRREESFARFDAWPAVLACFEDAVERRSASLWQDAVRCLELDDAARQSVQKRRVNVMEYQEASEEVGFKGTMTLAGCGVLWCVLLLLIASMWLSWARWLILPLLLVFAVMQLLRWVIPANDTKQPPQTPDKPG